MIKQFLQHMIVLQALVAFNLLTPLAQAEASNPFPSKWTQNFHKNWNLENSVKSLKKGFPTKQDHKEIDALYDQFKNNAPNFKFMPDENGVAFWLDGQKAFIFNGFDKDSVAINGHQIFFKNGVSFNKFKMDFQKAVKTKDFSLQSLFIDEAHAILPFLIGAVVIGAIAAGASSANAGTKCGVVKNDFAFNLTKGKFKNGRKCPSDQMPRDYAKRIKEVAPNFKSNGIFNTKEAGGNYPFNATCVSKFVGSLKRPGAVQLCKCIEKKQKRCGKPQRTPAHGWNMTYPMAEQTCMAGYRHHYQGCQTPPATTNPGPVEPTPDMNCTGPKTRRRCTPKVPVAPPTEPVPDTRRPPKTDR